MEEWALRGEAEDKEGDGDGGDGGDGGMRRRKGER
jgi:hypothetical protein